MPSTLPTAHASLSTLDIGADGGRLLGVAFAALLAFSQHYVPAAVPELQPHLRKCFEAIESLDFGPGGEISAMNSREREKVPFDKSMLPQGNVEIWLGEVERRMRSSVRQQVVLAMAAYANTPRKQWVREWPAMVVLAVSAIYWSREVEEAIEGGCRRL